MAKKSVTKENSGLGCKCIEQVNEQLEESGCWILQGMEMNFATGKCRLGPPTIHLIKLPGSKKKLPSVVCTHCPFCGKKYADA